jgi:hypothetical protein
MRATILLPDGYTIVVRNTGQSSVEFWLEPWGDGEGLPPDATATVRFAQQHRLELEIEVQPDRVMVRVNSDTLPEEDSSRRQFVIAERDLRRRGTSVLHDAAAT